MNTPVEERLQRLTTYLVQDPNNTRLLTDAGEAALEAGNAEAASTFFGRASVLDSDSPRIKLGLTLVSLARGKFDQAIAGFASLVETSPDDPELRYGLVSVHSAMGNFAAAWNALLDGVESEPENPVPLHEALPAIQAITERDPRAAALCVRILHHLNRLEDAAELGRYLLPLCKDSADLRGTLATVLTDLMQLDQALALADEALALDPAQPDALTVRGLNAMATGDIAQAQAAFDHAMHSNNGSARATAGAAMVALLNHRYADAEAAFCRVLTDFPSHLGSWQALAWAQVSQSKYADAAATLQHALEINPNFSETHGSLAILAILQGKREESHAAMRRALGLDPASLSGRYAQYLLLQKSPTRASALMQAMLNQEAINGRTIREQFTLLTGTYPGGPPAQHLAVPEKSKPGA